MESVSLALSSVSLKDDSPLSDCMVKIIISSENRENQEFRCPKKLLVQHSKYFEAFFAFSQSKNHQDIEEVVQLKGGIDYDSIKTIWDGLSSPKESIDIDEENVQNILQASTFLQCNVYFYNYD